MIGAGNVGTHISRHLHSAGHQISCVYSRTAESARQLAGELGVPGTSRIEEVPVEADFYILAVPDREVSGVATQFAHTAGIWLHTAGALSMDVFKGIFPGYGVLYPLQTLSRSRPVGPSRVPCLVESNSPEVRTSLLRLASSTYDKMEEVDSEHRLALHTAAVFANNFSNHMIHIAGQILESRELDPHLLDPLLEETFQKLKEIDPGAAQTGPALRGDKPSMQKHIDLLKDHPEWEKLYTFISRDIERSRDD
jgi:predicted short-subunit dehydrogenase-like oxidoreductase (DUF2520 family)